jgi:hypothetical protein
MSVGEDYSILANPKALHVLTKKKKDEIRYGQAEEIVIRCRVHGIMFYDDNTNDQIADDTCDKNSQEENGNL